MKTKILLIAFLMTTLSISAMAEKTETFNIIDEAGRIFKIEIKIEMPNSEDDIQIISENKGEEKADLLDIRPFIKKEKEVEDGF